MSFSPIQKVALYLWARQQDHNAFLDREQAREEYAQRQEARAKRERQKAENEREFQANVAEWENCSAQKEEIIKAAWIAAGSTDWEAASGKLCELSEKWSNVGYAGNLNNNNKRLQQRFKEAKQVFYDRRSAARFECIKAKKEFIEQIKTLVGRSGSDPETVKEGLERKFYAIGDTGSFAESRIKETFDRVVQEYITRLYSANHKRKLEILGAMRAEFLHIHPTQVEEYIVDRSDDLFYVGFSGPYESKEQKIFNELADELRAPDRRWRPKVTVETRKVRRRPAA